MYIKASSSVAVLEVLLITVLMASRPQYSPMTSNWPKCCPQTLALRVLVSASALKEVYSPCYGARPVVRATCFHVRAAVSAAPINGLNVLTMLE